MLYAKNEKLIEPGNKPKCNKGKNGNLKNEDLKVKNRISLNAKVN